MWKEFIMKRTQHAAAAGIVLALLCTLTGCPQEADDPEIDSALKGPWTNGSTVSYLEKKFEIQSDGTFETYLNPTALGAYAEAAGAILTAGGGADAAAATGANTAQGVVDLAQGYQIDTDWHVTGKLIRVEGDIYKMEDLKADESDKLITGPTETPPATSDAALALNGIIQNVRLTVIDNDHFKFSNAETDDPADSINMFFGGDYFRVITE
jgi:hypothetical protein